MRSILARATAGVPESQQAGQRFEALAELAEFRQEIYGCLTVRSDELFELAEAVLCAEGPVRTLVGLALAPEHRRGHGALYDAINHGRIAFARLRRAVAMLPLPRCGGRADRAGRRHHPVAAPGRRHQPRAAVLSCLRSPQRRSSDDPGWPYSIIAALETGRTSWTAVLDTIRLLPDDDEAAVTAGQARDLITRLAEACQWQEGDPDILLVVGAGYDTARLAFLLADLPVEVLGRLRSDRVLLRPAPSRQGVSCWPAQVAGDLPNAESSSG